MNLSKVISQTQVDEVAALLRKARKVVITCHMTPDGDALGSSLGLANVLAARGYKACVITPDTPPHTLDFLPGACDIIIASRHTERARSLLSTADLIFCLDYNAIKRIDRLGPLLEQAKAPRVMVDHHLDPEPMAQVMISHPEASSTCSLLYHLLDALGWADGISAEAATCIYTGMLTDTGNFSYNSNDPDLYLIVARLLERGLDKDRVYTLAWNTNRPNRLRVCGYALCHKMQLMWPHRMALMILTRAELDQYGYVKGDTEGLVNKPLSIPGIVYSAYIRQDDDNYVKISMRSVGDFPVNIICEKLFGGGGHLNAAGGEFHGPLDEAVSRLIDALPDYDRYLPDDTPGEVCKN